MSWFYEQKEIPSDKNGVIRCVRRFGRWKVMVGGYEETTPYMRALWNRSLKRLPSGVSIKKVLVLGLGAGGNIKQLHRRFPGCQVTAIEWDPAMVELAEQLRLFPKKCSPRVIIGDALDVLPKLEERYDLILFDLFQGRQLMAAHHPSFAHELQRLLAQDGYVLFNAFSEPQVFELLDRCLARHKTWRFRYNHVALYRQFGRGCVGDPLPQGYEQFRACEAYLKREVAGSKSMWIVGQAGCWGRRWKHGPLWFEGYMSDDAPQLEPFPHWRMIIWQSMKRKDRPAGWYRSWAQMNPRQTVFAEISDPEGYWKAWSPHAQRHRRRWLRDDRYTIDEVPFEEFLAIYRTTKKLRSLKWLFIKFLQDKVRRHGALVHFFAARERMSGSIIAALAVLDIPESRQSVHLLAFFLPQARQTSSGVGLIDFWFRHGVKRGLRFMDFDLSWAPGDPKEWKGFSQFKAQFGTCDIRYPNPLIKFVRPSGSLVKFHEAR